MRTLESANREANKAEKLFGEPFGIARTKHTKQIVIGRLRDLPVEDGWELIPRSGNLGRARIHKSWKENQQ